MNLGDSLNASVSRNPQKTAIKSVDAQLWYAKIPPGSHLTETLALICSISQRLKTQEASPA